MKEELRRIITINSELAEKNKEYSDARNTFNENVQRTILSGEEKIAFFTLDECNDYYDMANSFYFINGDVKQYADELKAEHPRYGEKRFRDTLVTNIIEAKELDYEEAHDEVYLLVSTHMFYEKNGYDGVRTLELETLALAQAANEQLNAVVKQTGDAINTTGTKVYNAVKGVVSPYVEVAKGQISTATAATKNKVKELTNKGTRKAISALEKIEKRTGSGE